MSVTSVAGYHLQLYGRVPHTMKLGYLSKQQQGSEGLAFLRNLAIIIAWQTKI